MTFWTEIHWSEGMFLRPHHLQAGQRWVETIIRAGLDAARPFGWGLSKLAVAVEPLEHFTLRLDRCELRLRDGTWLRIPENTEVNPLNFEAALDAAPGGADIFLGIPDMQEVRANSVSLEHPGHRPFVRRKDGRGRNGLQVELNRKWIDENLELFVALHSEEMDIDELEKYVYATLDLKLASPSRAPWIHNVAVRGLRFQIKSVPAGTLPRRQGLHYFKVDKTIGSDRTDYWKECEEERGIRMSIHEGQLAAMEQFKPTLYVPLKVR